MEQVIEGMHYIAMAHLVPSPTNPRKRFNPIKLQELADSIKEHGLVQAIVVRPWPEGREIPAEYQPSVADEMRYEIIAGERRYRASKLAEQEVVKCEIRQLSDDAVLEIQVIENDQRDDVNAIEAALGYQQILDSGIYGAGVAAIEKLAEKLGKKKRTIYNRLSLLKATEEARNECLDEFISEAHLVEIARLTPEAQYDAITRLCWNYSWKHEPGKPQKMVRGETHNEACSDSVRSFKDYLARLQPDLAKAPFATSSFDLLPMAGPCSTCAFRTGYDAEHRGEVGPDRCLNLGCYEQKLGAHCVALAQKAKASGKKYAFISQEYGKQPDFEGERVFNNYEWETSGDTLGIIVSGSSVGQSRPVTIRNTMSAADRKAAEAKQKEKEADEKRQKEIAKRVRARVIKEIDSAVAKGTAIFLIQALAQAFASNLQSYQFVSAANGAGVSPEANIGVLDYADQARLLACMAMHSEASGEWVNVKLPATKNVAKAFGIDFDGFMADARAENPPPEKEAKPKKGKKVAEPESQHSSAVVAPLVEEEIDINDSTAAYQPGPPASDEAMEIDQAEYEHRPEDEFLTVATNAAPSELENIQVGFRPSVATYRQAEEAHPGVLLAMRVGDFYEFYGNAAEIAAEALNITITSREEGGERIPMAGVPYHSVEKYLAILLGRGVRVALLDGAHTSSSSVEPSPGEQTPVAPENADPAPQGVEQAAAIPPGSAKKPKKPTMPTQGSRWRFRSNGVIRSVTSLDSKTKEIWLEGISIPYTPVTLWECYEPVEEDPASIMPEALPEPTDGLANVTEQIEAAARGEDVQTPARPDNTRQINETLAAIKLIDEKLKDKKGQTKAERLSLRSQRIDLMAVLADLRKEMVSA